MTIKFTQLEMIKYLEKFGYFIKRQSAKSFYSEPDLPPVTVGTIRVYYVNPEMGGRLVGDLEEVFESIMKNKLLNL